jgi:cation-transporting ATPase E
LNRPDGRRPQPSEDGLSSAEAAKRLRKLGPPPETSSRSVSSIVAGNVFTLFNAIIGVFFVLDPRAGPVRRRVFGLIAIVNSYIGIRQELKAKRTLDELAVLVAPQREGRPRRRESSLLAEEVVPGDVIAVEPGDQLVADGEVDRSRGMTLDESMLTGEADGIRKERGDRRSPAPSASPARAATRSTPVREQSYAGRLAGEARAFRPPAVAAAGAVNRVIVSCTWAMAPLAALLLITFQLRAPTWSTSAQTATAGLVTLIPRAGPADERHLRRGGGAAGAQGHAGAADERHREPRRGRHDLRRQDRHADRR